MVLSIDIEVMAERGDNTEPDRVRQKVIKEAGLPFSLDLVFFFLAFSMDPAISDMILSASSSLMQLA